MQSLEGRYSPAATTSRESRRPPTPVWPSGPPPFVPSGGLHDHLAPPDHPSSNGAGLDRPRPIFFCWFTGIFWLPWGLAHGTRAT